MKPASEVSNNPDNFTTDVELFGLLDSFPAKIQPMYSILIQD
jgi:hypothetical protein